jgi:hypothetical protein
MKIERILSTSYPTRVSDKIEAERKNTVNADAVEFDGEKRQRKDQQNSTKDKSADSGEFLEEAEISVSEALQAHKKSLDVVA